MKYVQFLKMSIYPNKSSKFQEKLQNNETKVPSYQKKKHFQLPEMNIGKCLLCVLHVIDYMDADA